MTTKATPKIDPAATPEQPRRGRPVTGTAKTSTERGRAADEALVASGGRLLNRLRISPAPASALSALSEHYGSDREAIEQALLLAAASLH